MIREYLLPGWLLFVQICITLAFVLTFLTLGLLALELVRWPLKIVLQYEWLMTKISFIALTVASKSKDSPNSHWGWRNHWPTNLTFRCADFIGNSYVRFQRISSRLAHVSQIQYHFMVIWFGCYCYGITWCIGSYATTRSIAYVWHPRPSKESSYANGNARAGIPSITFSIQKFT